MDEIVITIDGASATGKTFLANSLAEKLNFKILPTGLIYRKIAKTLGDVSNLSEDEITAAIAKIDFNDLDISQLLHEDLARVTSKISAIRAVRNASNKVQREFADKHKKVIVEGRDAGSVVFPNANLKLYITASAEVRAMRRFKQLQENNIPAIYEDVLRDIEKRDFADQTREIDPLKIPEGAIVVDTSELLREDALEFILNCIKDKLKINF
jgi:cytidylate kinase